ncbi:MAG TPA: hypothetical protein PKE58_10005 [Acidobacteriota bacterium]|nr:hypothetical protein [Acidobacteriota bacterium]
MGRAAGGNDDTGLKVGIPSDEELSKASNPVISPTGVGRDGGDSGGGGDGEENQGSARGGAGGTILGGGEDGAGGGDGGGLAKGFAMCWVDGEGVGVGGV